jgi:hypothetical protein
MAIPSTMRTLTLRLSGEANADLERAAEQEGTRPEKLAAELLVAALRGLSRKRGSDAWNRLKAAGSDLDQATAEAIAGEALAQVRAERRASGL